VRIGVVCYPTIGGSGVVAVELARGLAARGHDLHLLSYAPPARLPEFDARVTFHEVEVSSYPLFRYPPYEVALASRLSEVAEDVGLDVLHAHYAIPHTLAALLVKDIVAPRPLPVVTTLHGTDITVVGQDRSYRRVTEHALRRSDAVTAVSEWLRAQTEQVFAVGRPIEVIPNFVDAERFRPRAVARARVGLAPPGERVVAHVSNFRPVKRAVLVVEAFRTVAAAMPARLVMIGDGPDRAACEARARALGLRDRVRFLGAQSSVEDLLPCADVLLLPSEYESFGLSALEAMACGVVPVVTRAGGLPEVVRDGVDGVLVDEGDLPSLGGHVLALLRDVPRLERLGAAAGASARERFSPARVVPRYEALYERLIASAPR
jgi:N-acetyl-alpha-D-glucosaminyl L-malate synthase BshA